MTSIYTWSTTAGSNASADADINWAEGQLPSTVNDSARVMMKRVAEWVKDHGALTLTGTDSLTVTANSGFAAYATGQSLVAKVANDNTGAVTLSVNGIGAKAVRKFTTAGEVALVAGDLQAGQMAYFVYDTAANGAAGAWILLNPSLQGLGTADSPTFTGLTLSGDATVSGGDLTVGGNADTDPTVVVNGAAASARQVKLQTAGVDRWIIEADTDAESGSNAGSDLRILARSDAGAAVVTALEIARATGNATFGASVTTGFQFYGRGSDGAAAPSFSWSDDTNTGFANPAADEITVNLGGSELIRYTGVYQFVGKTTQNWVTNGVELSSDGLVAATRSGGVSILCNRNTSNGQTVQFRRANTEVGSIEVTASATTYNTSSDYRLKANLRPLDGSIIGLIRVYEYDWKADGTVGHGVLAHELAEVAPWAVSGEKDAVDADGTIRPQGVDYSKLVPDLIAKVQSLEARLAALEP